MGESRPAARLIVARLPAPGETVRIAGAEAAHARARRLEAGDRVVLIDGSGLEAEGAVAHADHGGFDVRVDTARQGPAPAAHLALFVAGVRPERLDWIAEKATELGVTQIVIVAADRTQAFRASPARSARLERLVREAAKQCDRADWPQIQGPVPFARALADPAAHRLFLDAAGSSFPARLPAGRAALLVGPEGGWTADERDAALAAGWTAVRLPAGILRTETAAVAGLALLRAALDRAGDGSV